jgi:AraC-like DNA-binding protein
MMNIEITIDKLDSFLPCIAQQLHANMENDSFQLPKHLGEGFFKQVQFNPSFLLTYYELKLYDTTTIVRKKSENDAVVPIIFWVSDSGITQQLQSEKKQIGKSTPHGIFLPSNRIETVYSFPAGIPIKNITVFFDKGWLRDQIYRHNDYINDCILSSQKFFLFEDISFGMTEIIERMISILNNDGQTLSRLSLYSDTLRLAYLFFDKILNRPVNKQSVNINPIDIAQIFKVKAILVNQYMEPPSVEELAREAGMNERKMQKIFKHIFGKNIYQYGLAVKMNEAKKMLQQKKYSISEIGYMVGYTNLSHFSAKFKQYYGLTPKSFLASLNW